MTKKINELTATTTLVDADLFAVVDVSDTAQSANGSTRKITAANVAASASMTSRYVGQDGTITDIVKMTAAAYAALGVKDPTTLYVIVG